MATGNPHGEAVNDLRALIIAHATPQRFTEVVNSLYEAAVEGDTAAAKEYLDRCLGKPNQTIQTEDVTAAREWTDEQILAGFLRWKIPESEWPDELLVKFKSGRIRVESREVNVQKELPG